ncbi:hypothetical protein [Teredinibacter purpureus]|uniref:hypothetical protein n=1 Tax=Teredinibacter purpureus TaxID=2731756 RepID=UPI0005F86034|nr:hypothetical protein [Teredinibacter purpureus]
MKKIFKVSVLLLIVTCGLSLVIIQDRALKGGSVEVKEQNSSLQNTIANNSTISDNQSLISSTPKTTSHQDSQIGSAEVLLSDEDIERDLAGLPTTAQIQAGAEYNREHGWVDQDASEIYTHYSTTELNALANAGDLIAIDTLALRYGAEGKTKEMLAMWRKGVLLAQVQTPLP